MNRILVILLLVTTISCSAPNVPQPEKQSETGTRSEVQPAETKLPRVLILGDSISRGFTPHVVQQLNGEADVKHHEGNAKHTGIGLKNLDQWICETKWDAIHFNWGLWDLCYRHPESKTQGKRDKVNGTLTTTLEQYEKNLDILVARLKKTDAKLIWAHTTVVPEQEAGRIRGDDVKYNEAAARVMKKHGIPINDLHTLTKTFAGDQFDGPGNVHYTQEGYQRIGQQVTDHILKILEAEQQGPVDKE